MSCESKNMGTLGNLKSHFCCGCDRIKGMVKTFDDYFRGGSVKILVMKMKSRMESLTEPLHPLSHLQVTHLHSHSLVAKARIA